MSRSHSFVLSLAIAAALAQTASASDLYRSGASPRSMGMASVAGLARDPLVAMANNPAFLAGSARGLQASVESFYVDADLRTQLGEAVSADKGPAFLPEVALAWPLGNDLTLGAGIKVDSGMKASFVYHDPPGTLGVSYGRQKHESEYLVVNSSLALGWQVSSSLQLGAQLGIAYNRNRLQAPYIFQSHPGLAGLKVLVDLDADDYAPTASLGMNYRASDRLSFNLAWRMESEFSATGELYGNLSALGLGIQEDFRYDTRVDTGLPASISTGFAYQATPALNIGIQVDWINWDKTFAELPIILTNGSNFDLNTFLGSTSILDTAPLNWDDQLTWHLGAEYNAGNRVLRGGYEHSDIPVPTATFTPMTAAIFEHAFSVGTTLPAGGKMLDLYYRYSFSSGSTTVNNSILLGGEHNNQSLDLRLHSFGLAVTF